MISGHCAVVQPSRICEMVSTENIRATDYYEHPPLTSQAVDEAQTAHGFVLPNPPIQVLLSGDGY